MTKQNLGRSTVWLIISELIFNLSGYIIHSFVGRILGPADYGRYGLVVTLTTMVIILIGNGIPTAMSKYISEIFETDPRLVLRIKKKAIWLQSILIAAITGAFFLCAPLIALALGDPSLTPLFRISTLIIPTFAAASFYFSWFTGLHKFTTQSIQKTLRSVFKVVFIVGMAWIWKVPGSIFGYALSAFAVFLVGFVIDKTKYTRQLKHAAKSQVATKETDLESKKLLNYAWQVIVFFLAYELLISIDLYLVKGILHDDYATGIYNAVLTVGRIPYYVFYALTIMLLPVISKTTANNEHVKTNAIISQSLRLMVILLVPSVILMSQFALPITRLFYNSKYTAAAEPMAILVYGVGFLTIFYVMSFVLNGAGKTKIPMVISIIGFIMNTGLNIVLIKKYALVGSAVATSVTSLIITLIILYYLVREFGKLMQISSLAKITASGIFIFYLAKLFPQDRFLFILWSLILLAVYFGVLALLGEIQRKDLVYLKGIVSKKSKQKEVQEELSGNEPSA